MSESDRTWEEVHEERFKAMNIITHRLRVEGGWIYRVTRKNRFDDRVNMSVCFVPYRTK